MIILGIDPGTTSIGFALIKTLGAELELLDAGLLEIPDKTTKDKRMKALYTSLSKIISKWRPDALAIEEIFFSKNRKTALAVAEARGAILLTTSLAGLTLYEYTPLEVKRAVVGHGGADKPAVQKIVKLTIPGEKLSNARDDVFDAVALALTCFFEERLRMRSP